MADYTMDDLEALEPEWEKVFGDMMPKGFEITPDQVPVMRQCIDERSQAPLEAYVATLGGNPY